MLLALGLQAELSLKLLHDSCGLRLMPNVGQQCSESHAQHQHSKQQQNIGARIHNDMDIAGSSLCILDMYRVVRKSEQESALLAGKPLKDGTDAKGRAGLRFLSLSEERSAELKEWLSRRLEQSLPESVAMKFRSTT